MRVQEILDNQEMRLNALTFLSLLNKEQRSDFEAELEELKGEAQQSGVTPDSSLVLRARIAREQPSGSGTSDYHMHIVELVTPVGVLRGKLYDISWEDDLQGYSANVVPTIG